MTNLFAKFATLGIIAAGFTLTGDLSWLARRGMDVIQAADVAADRPAEAQPSEAVPAAETPPIAATAIQPPTAGPATVSWASLAAGDRLVLWLGPAAARCLVLDIVDPSSGAAVAYEATATARDGRPLTAAGPPRRVVVGRPPERVPAKSLERGGLVHVADVGIAATREGRWLGPITAIALID